MSNIIVVVVLNHSKRKLIVPLEWINVGLSADIFISGVKKYVDRRIFVAQTFNVDPIFNLPIRMEFRENEMANYLGRVMKVFSECISKNYMRTLSNFPSQICRNDW